MNLQNIVKTQRLCHRKIQRKCHHEFYSCFILLYDIDEGGFYFGQKGCFKFIV